MQGWFSGQSSEEEAKPASSLLADWNSYASAQSSEDSSAFPFDIESAVRSANDTVSGTFSVVSKGVRDLPGNFQSATSNVPSGKALVYFGLFLASGVFFVFIAFTLFLPIMVVMPQKFALCFTLGCGFIIGSFFALKGPKNQLAHMLSMERLPFTLAFLGSMIGTIYVSMVLHSYILSVVFSVVQVGTGCWEGYQTRAEAQHSIVHHNMGLHEQKDLCENVSVVLQDAVNGAV
ncbi:hypothetical protein JHK84_049522 [Glycine max]|nr:hypothetical protein JHK84_049522 [Glycine max]